MGRARDSGGSDAITQEADVFAFGMVATEVGPHTLSTLVLEVEMVSLTSESCLRFLQEGLHSVNSQPGHYFKDYGWRTAGLSAGGTRTGVNRFSMGCDSPLLAPGPCSATNGDRSGQSST
jgi:hypothetical protein